MPSPLTFSLFVPTFASLALLRSPRQRLPGRMCVCVRVCRCLCLCVYVCICVCFCVSPWVSMYLCLSMPVHVCFCLSQSVSCTFFLSFICLESNISSLISPFCSSSESSSIHLQLTTHLFCTPSNNTRVTCSSALSGHPSSSFFYLFTPMYAVFAS